MMQKKITLVAFGYFERIFLEKVVSAIEKEFSSDVRLIEGHLDLSVYYDIKRRQYNGDKLLEMMKERFDENSGKTMGLFGVDLYIPILTHIFGQAYLNGDTGIASHFRLNNKLYGLEEDNQLLLERFIKEIIHELGHTYGLIHCHTPTCVMRSSTYAEDIDEKSRSFCDDCRQKIDRWPH